MRVSEKGQGAYSYDVHICRGRGSGTKKGWKITFYHQFLPLVPVGINKQRTSYQGCPKGRKERGSEGSDKGNFALESLEERMEERDIGIQVQVVTLEICILQGGRAKGHIQISC